MNYFPAVKRWLLPGHAYRESLREMAHDGQRGMEGIALWLGNRSRGNAEISHVVLLRGAGVVKQANYLKIEDDLLNDVTDKAIEIGVCLIGHIHSHSSPYGIYLSPSDKRYGINIPYYLSIVAPDYAQRENMHIRECGVHIFKPKSGFRRLTSKEVQKRIIIEPSKVCPVIIVGE